MEYRGEGKYDFAVTVWDVCSQSNSNQSHRITVMNLETAGEVLH